MTADVSFVHPATKNIVAKNQQKFLVIQRKSLHSLIAWVENLCAMVISVMEKVTD